MTRPALRISSLILALWTSTALTPALAEVKAVTLTSSGLSEVVEGTEGNTEIDLSFRADQISDVLKSLMLLGPGAENATLRLDSDSAADHVAGSLPFDPRRAGDLDYLLTAFPGAEVQVEVWEETLKGEIVGLAPSCVTAENCDTLLLLKTSAGILTRIPLAPEMKVRFTDPEINELLSRGFEAAARDASGQARNIHLRIDGKTNAGNPETLLSYVIPAPAWKTSWRAELRDDGTVGLQAWAIVENASGRDWNDIDLTLTSGSPRSLKAELYASDWRERSVIGKGQGAFEPVPFAESLQMEKFTADAAAPMVSLADMAPDVEASESQSEARYAFSKPVSVRTGEVVSMPFLGDALQARSLSRYIGGSGYAGTHPDLSLEIVNDGDVRLPAGIVTLQQAGLGYIGDAELPDIQPGETRTVAIGEDLKVSIDESSDLSSGEIHLKLGGGALMVEETNRRETLYHITAPMRETRLVVIDHPALEGWTVEKVEGAHDGEHVQEAGQSYLRHELQLNSGESAVLRIVERQPVSTTWALTDISLEQIEFWQGADISQDERDMLESIADLRGKEAELQRQRDDLASEREELVADQARNMELLQGLPTQDPAAARFRDAVLSLEDRIAEVDAADEDLKTRIETARKDLEDKMLNDEN